MVDDDGRRVPPDGRAGDAAASTEASDQARAWSAVADDYDRWWADLGAPVWQVALDAAGVTAGTRVLDVGCGPGRLLRRAADRGADVSGIDAAPRMVELARAHVPGADVRVGAMERLPWPPASFDAVFACNAVQFAADPADALGEVARVLAPGGSVGICVWGPREDRHVLDIDRAVSALVPDDDEAADGPPADDHPGVPDWSRPGAVEDLLRGAGLEPVDAQVIATPFVLVDRVTLVDAFLSDLQDSPLVDVVGLDAVRRAIEQAGEPFRQPDGSYRIPNTFRLAMARA